MTSSSIPQGPVRDRILKALADPDVTAASGIPPATLMAFQEPLAVLDWLGSGKGLVLLNHAVIREGDLAALLDHVLDAHEKGLLFIVVAGGGPAVADQLRAADERARTRDHVGLYHAEETGQIKHVMGRRLPELERAGRALPDCGVLSPQAIASIAERGRKERQAATEFVHRTTRRFPYATVAIIATCVLLYAITAGGDQRGRQLYELLRNGPEAIQRAELWRLLTYALLHDRSSPVHIMVNMLSLYSLGAFLEPLLGRWRVGLLCASTALAGGAASALLTRAPSVGASGAVWGLVGATLALLVARRRIIPALIARMMRQRFMVVLLLNLGMSFLPGIDRYCHFGGGLAGYLIAVLYVRAAARKPADGGLQATG